MYIVPPPETPQGGLTFGVLGATDEVAEHRNMDCFTDALGEHRTLVVAADEFFFRMDWNRNEAINVLKLFQLPNVLGNELPESGTHIRTMLVLQRRE